MSRLLVVVDMQNDFIDGALGTAEAVAIVPAVTEKIKAYQTQNQPIIFTKDTHFKNYMETREGKKLPVPHCVKDTKGWELCDSILELISDKDYKIYEKITFGSSQYAQDLEHGLYDRVEEVELIGLCTDICVISNAILTKTFLPETIVKVDSRCCAGVTPASHENALNAMKMCQIEILD